ncbi:hypothetical protein QP868_07040 [Brevibacterium sp. UMB1308A]|uniref:hypothetical protein n=1 Tax=Brevibacterium sp. UMB1308A TaxID=3050608 RepID=UPI00254F369B|nr:hypothetical protein [Brevibacterium sp. UMB1308A]MDK8346490.1 hypothetical protein [Brevibacterium sp. UMB1308B]MDK8713653.1 hypothetical protein [Brevibacterium sp. UMB1308A]
MLLPTVSFSSTLSTGPQVPFYADAGVVAMMFVAPVSLILLVAAIVLVVFAQLKPLHTTLLILLAVFVPILGPIIAIIIATVLKRQNQAVS